jgi:hypothetical protein
MLRWKHIFHGEEPSFLLVNLSLNYKTIYCLKTIISVFSWATLRKMESKIYFHKWDQSSQIQHQAKRWIVSRRLRLDATWRRYQHPHMNLPTDYSLLTCIITWKRPNWMFPILLKYFHLQRIMMNSFWSTYMEHVCSQFSRFMYILVYAGRTWCKCHTFRIIADMLFRISFFGFTMFLIRHIPSTSDSLYLLILSITNFLFRNENTNDSIYTYIRSRQFTESCLTFPTQNVIQMLHIVTSFMDHYKVTIMTDSQPKKSLVKLFKQLPFHQEKCHDLKNLILNKYVSTKINYWAKRVTTVVNAKSSKSVSGVLQR